MFPRPCAIALLALLAASARAEAPACDPGPGYLVDGFRDPRDDLSRLAELAGASPVTPGVLQRGGLRLVQTCLGGPALPWRSEGDPGTEWLRILPPRLDATWNSSYPTEGNDGLLWAGRGFSGLVTTGLAGRHGGFSFALAPELTASQNRGFSLVPNGGTGDARFLNAWYGSGIDLPQRFGDGAVGAWAPGQSFVRFDRWNLGVGLSSENLRFGPGLRSSMVLSDAAPGFPHLFVGTSRPGDVGIGTVEAKAFWARLERSRFMPGRTHPLITGLLVDYSPRWLPGLSVGLARVHLQVRDGLGLLDYFPFLESFQKQDLSGDDPDDNQLASVFLRWVFPEVGLEIWGEWAHEDHERSFLYLIREPDHSQGTQLGLQKVYRAGNRWIRIHLELTRLQEVRPLDAFGGTSIFYVHERDLSYTHRGQLLGAWIGPGADSQTLAVDVFHEGGRVGGYLERVRRNEAVYWAIMEPRPERVFHDTEVTAGLRQVLFLGPVELSWEAAASYRWAREFGANATNLKLGLQLATGRCWPRACP